MTRLLKFVDPAFEEKPKGKANKEATDKVDVAKEGKGSGPSSEDPVLINRAPTLTLWVRLFLIRFSIRAPTVLIFMEINFRKSGFQIISRNLYMSFV